MVKIDSNYLKQDPPYGLKVIGVMSTHLIMYS